MMGRIMGYLFGERDIPLTAETSDAEVAASRGAIDRVYREHRKAARELSDVVLRAVSQTGGYRGSDQRNGR